MPLDIIGTARDDVIDDKTPLGRTPEESETINGLGGNDTIYGFGGDDMLDGGEGNDILVGGAGNDLLSDTYNSIDDINILDGGDGDDRFYQNTGVNTMYGGAGQDSFSFIGGGLLGKNTIYGGDGYDSLESGYYFDGGKHNLGHDISEQIIFDVEHLNISWAYLKISPKQVNQFDIISRSITPDGLSIPVITLAGSGNANFADRADFELIAYTSAEGNKISTGKHIDTLIGGVGDDCFESGGGSDWLVGDGGNDLLNGGSGADTMQGGIGNDTYAVDNAGDRVVEVSGLGSDTIVSTVSYALADDVADGGEIEILQLARATGSANLNLTGSAFAQTLRGNKGANILDGKGGADSLYGKGGDDTYVVDNGGDRVFEVVGEGRDTIISTVSFKLAEGQQVETLQFARSAGAASLSFEGNEFDQAIFGNAGANKLNGGRGADTLTGKGGADTFIFSTKLGPGQVDHITDFASEDTIRLSKAVFAALAPGQLSESAFKVIGPARADADDRILYDGRSGELFYDADGSGKGAAVLFAVLDNKATLTAADFFAV